MPSVARFDGTRWNKIVNVEQFQDARSIVAIGSSAFFAMNLTSLNALGSSGMVEYNFSNECTVAGSFSYNGQSFSKLVLPRESDVVVVQGVEGSSEWIVEGGQTNLLF